MSFKGRLFAGVAVLLSLAVVACGGDDGVRSSGAAPPTEVPSESPPSSPDEAASNSPPTSSGAVASTTTTVRTEAACTGTQDFTTEAQQVLATSGDPIYLLDGGRHDAPECFDQLTFRLNGTAEVGYSLGYADGGDVRVEGDQSVPTAGDAALVFDISAPIQGGRFDQTGHQPGVIFAETVGQTLYPTSNPSGLAVIQEVRFAGELEAGDGTVASFAIGVDSRHPFSVSSFVNEGTRVIVIQVAH
jgi:hypothetical protein